MKPTIAAFLLSLLPATTPCAEPGTAEPEAVDKPVLIYKEGKPPEDIENSRQKWDEVLRRLPANAKVSDLKALVGGAKDIGIKSLKSLHTETWELDNAFFVVFEITSEDFGKEDPAIHGAPKLYSFRFVAELPSIEEILDAASSAPDNPKTNKPEQDGGGKGDQRR